MSSPISGFTAIPNPQMLAFMPIQSYLMMYFAGSGWQYGKRKISAMSNEQFNAMSPEGLLQQHSIELKNMLPTLDKTLNDVTPLIKTLILQYGDFIKEAIATIPTLATNLLGGGTGANPSSLQAGLLRYTPTQLQQYVDQLEREKAGSEQTEFSAKKQQERKQRVEDIHIREAMEKSAERARAGEFKLTVQVPKHQIQSRPAGQSQKLERIKLIKEISSLGLDVRKTSSIIVRQRILALLKQAQQNLVNLQTRYRF